MAEVIFRNLAKLDGRKDIVVKSAGVMTVNGLPMTPTAKQALKKCGEKLGKGHKSTLFSVTMLGEFDHIVGMTAGHVEAMGGETEIVYSLDKATGCGDIADPFMKSLDVYMECCGQLQVELRKLYGKLVTKAQEAK